MIEFNIDISKFRMKNFDDVSKISNNVVLNNNEHEQQNVSIIDNAIVQRQFENMTIVFQNLNHEIIQLRTQIWNRQKISQFNIVANASFVNDNSIFVTISQTQSISIVFVSHFKKQKSKNQSFYHEKNEDEHIRWFQNVWIKFLTCSNYFRDDRTKILWCMRFLKKNFQFQWFIRTNDDENLKNIFYDYFKYFFLNLITNSMNRRFIVYENWERIRQRSNQKMSNFKNELKKYEIHLFSFEKMHRINFFFCKLLSFLKKKLLNIEKMSTIKENLFAKIIMLKKKLKRERCTNDNSFNNSNFNNKRKDKNKNKFNNNFNNNNKFNSIKTFSMTMNAIRIRKVSENVKKKKMYLKYNVMNVIKWIITKTIVLLSQNDRFTKHLSSSLKSTSNQKTIKFRERLANETKKINKNSKFYCDSKLN